MIHVEEVHIACGEVWIAGRVADEVNWCRRQAGLVQRREFDWQGNRESEASGDGTIEVLVAPGANRIFRATASRSAAAGAIVVDAAVCCWLAELRFVVLERGGLILEIDRNREHSGIRVVGFGNPIA